MTEDHPFLPVVQPSFIIYLEAILLDAKIFKVYTASPLHMNPTYVF